MEGLCIRFARLWCPRYCHGVRPNLRSAGLHGGAVHSLCAVVVPALLSRSATQSALCRPAWRGCAFALRGCGARVIVTECDPICALQACMEGFQVATLEEVVGEADIFITTTGNFKIITLDSMKKMKNNAIVGNIGHFDNEIEMTALEGFPGIKVENIKPQVDRFVFPDGHGIIMLASGRLCNLGCATGPPSFVMSCSFTNQVLGQLDLLKNWKENKGYKNQVYLLPKELEEKVARLHLPALGANLTTLSKEQADYIGVKVEGPFKGDTYRY